jgi:hypothetical protein
VRDIARQGKRSIDRDWRVRPNVTGLSGVDFAYVDYNDLRFSDAQFLAVAPERARAPTGCIEEAFGKHFREFGELNQAALMLGLSDARLTAHVRANNLLPIGQGGVRDGVGTLKYYVAERPIISAESWEDRDDKRVPIKPHYKPILRVFVSLPPPQQRRAGVVAWNQVLPVGGPIRKGLGGPGQCNASMLNEIRREYFAKIHTFDGFKIGFNAMHVYEITVPEIAILLAAWSYTDLDGEQVTPLFDLHVHNYLEPNGYVSGSPYYNEGPITGSWEEPVRVTAGDGKTVKRFSDAVCENGQQTYRNPPGYCYADGPAYRVARSDWRLDWQVVSQHNENIHYQFVLVSRWLPQASRLGVAELRPSHIIPTGWQLTKDHRAIERTVLPKNVAYVRLAMVDVDTVMAARRDLEINSHTRAKIVRAVTEILRKKDASDKPANESAWRRELTAMGFVGDAGTASDTFKQISDESHSGVQALKWAFTGETPETTETWWWAMWRFARRAALYALVTFAILTIVLVAVEYEHPSLTHATLVVTSAAIGVSLAYTWYMIGDWVNDRYRKNKTGLVIAPS